nr:MAG TPA: hypothetical protein [Caudoviricetes sp.]
MAYKSWKLVTYIKPSSPRCSWQSMYFFSIPSCV